MSFRFALLISLSACVGTAAAAPPRPAQLGLCVACHGEDGIARAPGTPHLAGQDEQYLVDALKQYRSGRRDAAAMRAVSGALSEADIAAFARWYAAQVPRGGATR
jgi:cytochrome c553